MALDHVVNIGIRGDLREMGNAQDLAVLCEVGQFSPERESGRPSNSGVYLVKHQRGSVRSLSGQSDC